MTVSNSDSPRLLSSYKGFNLLVLGVKYCAVPQKLGPVDPLAEREDSSELIWAEHEAALRQKIDASGRVGSIQLVSSYRGFNLLAAGDEYCAVPQKLGAGTTVIERQHDHPELIWAEDEGALRRKIDSQRLWRRLDPVQSDTPLNIFGLPEVLEIEPIHTCNLRCIMCHVSYEKLSKQRLDIKFLDHIQGLEGKWAKLGSLYEPVAHPDFDRIVRGLTERGMDIDLITNGTLFTASLIERIKDCNFANVTISFDGVRPETYERIRARANFVMAIERIPVGSIYDKTLLDIWHGESAEHVRNLVKQNVSVCHACEYYQYCIKANEVDYGNPGNFVSENKIKNVGFSFPYSFVEWMNHYYAAPCWVQLTAADLADKTAWYRKGLIEADSLKRIYKLAKQTPPPLETIPLMDVTRLGRYLGYAVFFHDGMLYGVPDRIWPLDLTEQETQKRDDIVAAASLMDLRVEITARLGMFEFGIAMAIDSIATLVFQQHNRLSGTTLIDKIFDQAKKADAYENRR